MGKILEHDSFTGITETYYKDPSTGKVGIKSSQDVDKIFHANVAECNNAVSNWGGDFHKVASIPLNFINMWQEELRMMGADNINPLSKENRDFLIAKINSRDWAKIRTKSGRV